MKILIIIAASVLLSACIITSEFPLPDGRTAYQLTNCKDQAWCARKAAKICGGRYEVVNEGERQYSTVSSGGGVTTGFSIPQHELTITCPK